MVLFVASHECKPYQSRKLLMSRYMYMHFNNVILCSFFCYFRMVYSLMVFQNSSGLLFLQLYQQDRNCLMVWWSYKNINRLWGHSHGCKQLDLPQQVQQAESSLTGVKFREAKKVVNTLGINISVVIGHSSSDFQVRIKIWNV